MIYATVNASNVINAFYEDEIHGAKYLTDIDGNPTGANPATTIPLDAFEVDDATRQAHVSGEYKKRDGGAWVDAVESDIFTPEELLDNAIQAKQNEILSKFEELEGVPLKEANSEKQRYIDPSLIFTAKHLANIGAADVAFIFISSQTDTVAIGAYDVEVEPNWQ